MNDSYINNKWFQRYHNKEVADLLTRLQAVTPYTDKEIIEAIDTVHGVIERISLYDCVNLIFANEISNLEQREDDYYS